MEDCFVRALATTALLFSDQNCTLIKLGRTAYLIFISKTEKAYYVSYEYVACRYHIITFDYDNDKTKEKNNEVKKKKITKDPVRFTGNEQNNGFPDNFTF